MLVVPVAHQVHALAKVCPRVVITPEKMARACTMIKR